MYSLTVGRRQPGGSDYHLSPIPTKLRWYGGIMRTCIIPDCENIVFSKGYCRKHYAKLRKYGDPLYALIETHGKIKTAEYRTWGAIKNRCYNKNIKNYHRYGGRGIIVCNRWLHSFVAFYIDMCKKPFPKAQIDRIDNNGNYEPGNCHWTTHIKNCRNSSYAKLTIEKAEDIRTLYFNNKITQKQIAAKYLVCLGTINHIIHNRTWVK